MKRFGRISMLTLGILGLSLVIGLATSRQVRAAVTALVTVANTAANPVPTQSMDAQTAFQANLTVGFNGQSVAIPQGQRLVIDFVTINGVVQSGSGPVQPSVILASTLNGGPQTQFWLQPGPSPVNLPGENQLYLAQPVKIYADTLYVLGACAGYSPSFYSLNVSISGHLVPIT
jgi:hypothetical protein